jgi:hypothetical protein
MGDRDFGPAGSKTNDRPIDRGTMPRTLNLPPGSTGILLAQATLPQGRGAKAAPPPPPPYFDVARLLPVLAFQKWTVGKDVMKFWIDGKECTANLDSKIGKATIGANLTNTCMRTFTVSWDWILGSTTGGWVEVQKQFTNLKSRSVLFSENAKKGIIKTYAGTPGVFGDWLSDGLAPSAFQSKIKDHQLQKSELVDASGLDDIGAALAKFFFYVFYQGDTFTSANFRSRLTDIRASSSLMKAISAKGIDLSPTSAKPTDVETKRVDDNLAKLESGFKAIIVVKAVGIYLGDIYEFNGAQYLGHWDLTNKKVDIHYISAAWNSDSAEDAPDKNNVIWIGNATFRKYRTSTNMGGDFLIFSPVKLLAVKSLGGNGEDEVIFVPK